MPPRAHVNVLVREDFVAVEARPGMNGADVLGLMKVLHARIGASPDLLKVGAIVEAGLRRDANESVRVGALSIRGGADQQPDGVHQYDAGTFCDVLNQFVELGVPRRHRTIRIEQSMDGARWEDRSRDADRDDETIRRAQLCRTLGVSPELDAPEKLCEPMGVKKSAPTELAVFSVRPQDADVHLELLIRRSGRADPSLVPLAHTGTIM